MSLLDQFGAPLGRDNAEAFARLLAEALVCRGCGCDEHNACIDPRTGEPCGWTLVDCAPLDSPQPTGLCSTCAERVGFHPIALAAIGRPGSIADYVPAGLERYADDIGREIAA